MRQASYYSWIIILALLPLCASAQIKGKVIGISDGDTFSLLIEDSVIKVRLVGIDCPEKSQAFGQKAKQYLSDKIYNKPVKVVSYGADKYGRTLGLVLCDGDTVNYSLLRNGYAWHYTKYDKNQYLNNLESEAKNNKLGLWIDANPIAPWNFRKQSK